MCYRELDPNIIRRTDSKLIVGPYSNQEQIGTHLEQIWNFIRTTVSGLNFSGTYPFSKSGTRPRGPNKSLTFLELILLLGTVSLY